MGFFLLALALQGAPIEHELYRTRIAAAESAIRLGEFAVARSWLDETDPGRRGFEWRVHDAELDESLVRVSVGDDPILSIAAGSSGSGEPLPACGRSSGAVELRSAEDGAWIATLGTHEEGVTWARFDAGGERLVTSSFDRTVKVWDVEARELALDFRGHGYPVGGASFHPDGRWIASCSYERPPGTVVGTVHLWDPLDGTVVRTMHGGRKPLIGAEFSPDGRFVAAGSWDFCVFVWSVDGGEPVRCAMPDEGLYNAVDGLAWSPDGTFVAGASKDRTGRVWRAATGELVASLRGHTDQVGKLAFSPAGDTLATASSDGTVRLWNTSDWSARSILRGHADDVLDLAFLSDGRRLVTTSGDGSMRFWDAETRWYGGAGVTGSAGVHAAVFSPDDTRIASGSFDGRISLWGADTLELEAAWQAHPEEQSCHALAWTSDGRGLLSGSWEPVVRLWDAATGTERAAFEQPEGTTFLATSPTGPLAVTCSGARVFVWDLEARTRRTEFTGHGKTVLAAHFDPEGRRVVSSGRDGQTFVWDATTGAVSSTLVGAGEDVSEALFTPDGRQIVVAGRNGVVNLHSAADGALVRQLLRHRHGIDHLDLSPDGTRAAVTADTVVLIDLAHGGIVGQLRVHRERPYGLDFDAEGLRLVTCSSDGTLAVSDTRAMKDRLRARAASFLAPASRGR